MRSYILVILAIGFGSSAFGQDNQKTITKADVLVRTYQNTRVTSDSTYNMKIVAGKKMELLILKKFAKL